MKKPLFLALSVVMATGGGAFGQKVQTCTQAAAYAVQQCQGLPRSTICKNTVAKSD